MGDMDVKKEIKKLIKKFVSTQPKYNIIFKVVYFSTIACTYA